MRDKYVDDINGMIQTKRTLQRELRRKAEDTKALAEANGLAAIALEDARDAHTRRPAQRIERVSDMASKKLYESEPMIAGVDMSAGKEEIGMIERREEMHGLIINILRLYRDSISAGGLLYMAEGDAADRIMDVFGDVPGEPQERGPVDHIVTIEQPDAPAEAPHISTIKMARDDAHELFAWLTSYLEGVEITLEQVIPTIVSVTEKRRLLWERERQGGPTHHIANALAYPQDTAIYQLGWNDAKREDNPPMKANHCGADEDMGQWA